MRSTQPKSSPREYELCGHVPLKHALVRLRCGVGLLDLEGNANTYPQPETYLRRREDLEVPGTILSVQRDIHQMPVLFHSDGSITYPPADSWDIGEPNQDGGCISSIQQAGFKFTAIEDGKLSMKSAHICLNVHRHNLRCAFAIKLYDCRLAGLWKASTQNA